MNTFTATAKTVDGVPLQYETCGEFRDYRGDVKHFESYEAAKEAADAEMKLYTTLTSYEILEHETEEGA